MLVRVYRRFPSLNSGCVKSLRTLCRCQTTHKNTHNNAVITKSNHSIALEARLFGESRAHHCSDTPTQFCQAHTTRYRQQRLPFNTSTHLCCRLQCCNGHWVVQVPLRSGLRAVVVVTSVGHSVSLSSVISKGRALRLMQCALALEECARRHMFVAWMCECR